MALQLSDIDRVAYLAHLHLSEEEKSQYLSQLQSVLHQMAAFNQLDIPDFSHEELIETPLREDVVVKQPDLMLEKNAPHWESGCFSVPKMLEDV